MMMVRAKVLSGFCISPGVDAVVGETVSLDPGLYRWMLSLGRVEPAEEAPAAPVSPAPEPATEPPVDPAANLNPDASAAAKRKART